MTQDLYLYRDLAKYYDLQYSWKNTPGEVRRLEEIVRRFGRSDGRSWLDVACGTGRHLERLRRRHDCMGVDSSAEMLRVARRRLPGVGLVRADMRAFSLGRQFDVVSCLFSAIGHLESERDLVRTFARFAAHLKPGGVAIVEPWIPPSQARPGHVHLTTYEDRRVTLVRLAYSTIRGRWTVIRYFHLIGIPGRGIRFLEEVDRGLMVDREGLQRLMRSAGLTPHFLARGFTRGRGLLIGVKPRTTHRTGRRSGETA
jgi:ubiquinone/menaquinone biosynthesis C-methylase UbiE